MTEAGEGEDGRMKSAIGIGALLADGLGMTSPPCNRNLNGVNDLIYDHNLICR